MIIYLNNAETSWSCGIHQHNQVHRRVHGVEGLIYGDAGGHSVQSSWVNTLGGYIRQVVRMTHNCGHMKYRVCCERETGYTGNDHQYSCDIRPWSDNYHNCVRYVLVTNTVGAYCRSVWVMEYAASVGRGCISLVG